MTEFHPADPDIRAVLDFWFRELTPGDWFVAGAALDPVVKARFGMVHEKAGKGELDHWAQEPLGRLALILVLDQFSRHIHRGTAQAFANDARAQALCLEGLDAGEDERLSFAHRHFFYMPLMHAEAPGLQARSVERFTALRDFAEHILAFAKSHQADIAAFGRFPYRNAALGRTNTAAEETLLKERNGP